MQVETNRKVATIAEMLELYSERLVALQDELCAVSGKLTTLSSDLRDIITATNLALEAADIGGLQTRNDAGSGRSAAVIGFGAGDITVAPPAERSAIVAAVEDLIETDPARSDDLTLIAGIDAQVIETLHGFGIQTFAAIAGIGGEEATAIGMLLGDADLISRESWIEQAEILADGGLTAYARFVRSSDNPNVSDGFTADTLPVPAAVTKIDADTAPRIETARPALQLIEGGKQPLVLPLDDLVLEHDQMVSDLLQSAAAIARSNAGVAEPPLQMPPEFAALPASVSTATAATETAEPEAAAPATGPGRVVAGTAEIIDLASRRKVAPRRRRPIAIAASLAVVIAVGTTMTISADRLLGLDLAAITSCGEALIAGNPSCLHLPASSY